LGVGLVQFLRRLDLPEADARVVGWLMVKTFFLKRKS